MWGLRCFSIAPSGALFFLSYPAPTGLRPRLLTIALWAGSGPPPGHRRLLGNGIRWVAARLGAETTAPEAPARTKSAR